jgi:hypothetical protein
MPPALVLGPKTRHVQCRYNPMLSHLPPFFAFGMYVMYIFTFLHMLMYKILKNSCPYIPTFLHPQPQQVGVPRLGLGTRHIPTVGRPS